MKLKRLEAVKKKQMSELEKPLLTKADLKEI